MLYELLEKGDEKEMRQLGKGMHVPSLQNRLLLMSAIVVCLLCVACNKQFEGVSIDGAWVELRPVDDQKLPDLDTTEVIGTVSEEDIFKILAQVSRIPSFKSNPTKIWTQWDGWPVAARVAVDSHYVYCVKDSSGNWAISKITRILSSH